MDVNGCPFGSFNMGMARQGIFRKGVTSFLDESLAANYIERSNRKRKRSESELVAQQPPAIVQQPPAIAQQPSVVQQPSALAVCQQISRHYLCQSQVQGIPTVFGMWGTKVKKTCDACCAKNNSRNKTQRKLRRARRARRSTTTRTTRRTTRLRPISCD